MTSHTRLIVSRNLAVILPRLRLSFRLSYHFITTSQTCRYCFTCLPVGNSSADFSYQQSNVTLFVRDELHDDTTDLHTMQHAVTHLVPLWTQHTMYLA